MNLRAAVRDRFAWGHLVIAVAAFVAILPLMLRGCSCGHDFTFHVDNWIEVARQWHHGIIRPVWHFTAAWLAGEPRFLLYPPASWALGGFLSLILPIGAVPAAYTWICLFLSGLTMRRMLCHDIGEPAATLGACIYLASPYMLFVAYERTAYGELLAAAWMPLLLTALLRPHDSGRAAVWRLSIPVALLWVTNAPAAVIGSYSVLIMGLVRMVQLRWGHRRMMLRYARTVIMGFALGLLLASFYLVPAYFARSSVQIFMATIPGLNPMDNFLFGHTSDAAHDRVLWQTSRIAITVLACAALAGFADWMRMRSMERVNYAALSPRELRERRQASAYAVLLPMAIYSLAVLFLLLPVSHRVWTIAPELAFLQFPWRFLAMESAVAVVVLTLALPANLLRARTSVTLGIGLVLVAAGTLRADLTYRQGCEATDRPSARLAISKGHDGVEPTDEYTPVNADNDALNHPTPDAWLGASAEAAPPAQPASPIVVERPGLHNIRYHTPPNAGSFLIVRQRRFEGWHIVRDGLELEGVPSRQDGLIAVPLITASPHVIALHYHKTTEQLAGAGLSLLGGVILFAMVGMGWLDRRRAT